MSNYDLQIYKKLSTILVIQLVFMLFVEIFSSFIYSFLINYLYIRMGYSVEVYIIIISVISFVLFFIPSLIIMIIWVVHLSKLYRASGDRSVESARNLFLGGLIAEVLRFLLSFADSLLLSISDEIYFIGMIYLPILVINSLYILAWVKLSNHFKTTFVSKNGKNGCILIILSMIPSILSHLVHIFLTLLYGPYYIWGISYEYIILSNVLSGAEFLGIILEIIGYIMVIWVFKKTNTPQSPMTTISPDSSDRNNITPEEPSLNAQRYCTQCGAPTVPGATFCNQCGETI
ncbi:MAG: zinc ribbon domain-containing protein [Promethearchaeota archaeon]